MSYIDIGADIMEDRKACYLIVDDEAMIRSSLASFLARYDIESYQAADASEARLLMEQHHFDLITLDVLMPGESGIEFLQWVKKKQNIPVILLTSLDESVDKIIGLEVGADDYLCKPFDPRELLARAKAILRRYQQEPNVSGKSSTFSVKGRFLSIEGDRHCLSPKEFILINDLLAAGGEPVSRDGLNIQLFDRSWHPADRGVDNIIMRLRQKIEPAPDRPKYIITVRHKGYMIPLGAITVTD